ncbi:serine/threonine-protein kinase fray2 [Parasteatoda tepidariorum]|nr:serine/threonine-protein kinase fray2 [Parasteatoda tepidariorum]
MQVAIAPAMSREVYGSSSVSQRSPKPPRRPDIHRDTNPDSSSKYYPSSISQPVSGRVSPVGSRAVPSDQGVGRRSSRHGYGVSRSSNASPLTVPTDGPVPHSISTSAFNVGHGRTASSHHYYNEDLGSPTMDGRGGTGGTGTAPGHHRSRSATRVPLRNYHSLERDQDREFVPIRDPIRDPRDRSLDRTDMTGSGSRHPRSRERSLDRAGYRDRDDHAYRDMDGPLEADPYRDTGHSMSRSGHGAYSDTRHGYGGRSGGDGFVTEMQQRLNDLQLQYSNMKRELDATTQKLGSSMHSIKTFWSPELKKERALRKEEAAKYALINDQLKILRSENQVRFLISNMHRVFYNHRL